jgi:hypothetical protein
MCLISYVCIKNVDIRFSWHDEFLNYLPFLEKPFMNSLLCCITRVCVCVCVCAIHSITNVQFMNYCVVRLIVIYSRSSYMISSNGCIYNTVINLLIYINPHLRIVEEIINIIPEQIHVFIQYVVHRSKTMLLLFLSILFFSENKNCN